MNIMRIIHDPRHGAQGLVQLYSFTHLNPEVCAHDALLQSSIAQISQVTLDWASVRMSGYGRSVGA